MKRNRILTSLVLAVIAALLAGCQAPSGSQENGISLEQLKHQEEFRLHEIAWGTALDGVTKELPYAVERNEQISADNGAVRYITKEAVAFDGQNAAIDLEFVNDKLAMARLRISVDGDAKAWFEAQAEKMEKQFGKADDTLDSTAGSGYKWEAGTTMLQIVYVSTESGKEPVQIALGDKELYQQFYANQNG